MQFHYDLSEIYGVGTHSRTATLGGKASIMRALGGRLIFTSGEKRSYEKTQA